ncbi:hypothetical protein [Candidatus Pelagibacter sp. HIMB1321]|uniref:hypothetical protein n=1 Tax=Candidatus Pelagibacter sp. HIMB1321 TaxID=1388755 RepID=UPI000A07EFF0|nr:hypothetical protein [Candidatus Pelagibacter sp. HIMB1321]SMF76984.1 hypothetical protein SAMN02744631_0763 [Candidatus Pelagibacter sp. HIMB1321]
MTSLQIFWSIICAPILYFLIRFVFFHKDKSGKYVATFNNTFLWEYAKWWVKAIIFLIILAIILSGGTGIFDL